MPIRVKTKTTHCTDDPSFYLDVQDAHYLIWQKNLFDKKTLSFAEFIIGAVWNLPKK